MNSRDVTIGYAIAYNDGYDAGYNKGTGDEKKNGYENGFPIEKTNPDGSVVSSDDGIDLAELEHTKSDYITNPTEKVYAYWAVVEEGVSVVAYRVDLTTGEETMEDGVAMYYDNVWLDYSYYDGSTVYFKLNYTQNGSTAVKTYTLHVYGMGAGAKFASKSAPTYTA